jgi:hypothetical protein
MRTVAKDRGFDACKPLVLARLRRASAIFFNTIQGILSNRTLA